MGAPDFLAEVLSPSTRRKDCLKKLGKYLNAGVKEYWIVDPISKKIFVYHLEETDFKADSYTFQDKVKVNIYSDLWIDFTELGL